MALIEISPVEARVSWDQRLAQPSSVRWGARWTRVLGLTAVRDERAAYPAVRGPRVTYLLETDAGQASVVFDARRRRWYVEAIDQAA